MLRVFSGNTPITPSGGFSVETLTGVTPSWKTKLNRSISTMKDRIPGWLQHRHKTCYEKGGCCGGQACMFWRWLHCRDVVSGWVDLHITDSIVIWFLFFFLFISLLDIYIVLVRIREVHVVSISYVHSKISTYH